MTARRVDRHRMSLQLVCVALVSQRRGGFKHRPKPDATPAQWRGTGQKPRPLRLLLGRPPCFNCGELRTAAPGCGPRGRVTARVKGISGMTGKAKPLDRSDRPHPRQRRGRAADKAVNTHALSHGRCAWRRAAASRPAPIGLPHPTPAPARERHRRRRGGVSGKLQQRHCRRPCARRGAGRGRHRHEGGSA